MTIPADIKHALENGCSIDDALKHSIQRYVDLNHPNYKAFVTDNYVRRYNEMAEDDRKKQAAIILKFVK